MLDWHKALQTIRAQHRRHHLKASRLNKKGFEGQDRFQYTYIRHTMELSDHIVQIRRTIKLLEKIDKLRKKKDTPRNKLAGRNRREVKF